MAEVQAQPGPSTPVSDLRKSIEAHDETFTKLLSLIPAQYYIVDTPEEADTKWMRNKKKRSADELTETRKKAKFDKFDPSNNKTIPELQAERAAKAARGEQNADEDAMPPGIPIVPMAPASSVSDLRKKLQDKIDSFRKRRREAPLRPEVSEAAAEGKEDGNGTDDDGMTAASRDEMLEERRKRRGEVRDNRRNRRKEERRLEREAKSGKKKDGKDTASGDKKNVDVTAKTGKTALIVDPLPKGAAQTKPKAPAVPEDNVSFASIALPSTSGAKSSSHLKNISNPTQALQHLQNQKAKLAELPAEKRKQIEEKEKWAKALERAEGGKVRDDEIRLKKAAKRVDKQKAKSSKEWSDRKEELRNAATVKAKKRNENIAARKKGATATKKKKKKGGF
ncbi:hypothetical protein NliqN6_5329 [Naganishia liquefaciens]|uniref:SURF6-domain-containing protein n=1 Tax=Naganishia liquefaciens TaxID=104408 RepID=A0A8H3TXG6_9TREE|nr:hypothetical protein NliqN6_5329 [Naganishia liquefaciens]